MEKQKIDISFGDEAVTLNLHLINNDLISIPLLKKTENIGFTTTNYNNYFYAGYNTLSQPNYLNPNTNKTTNTNLNLRQNSNTISNPAIPEKVNIAKINPNILPHSIEIANNPKSKTNNRPIIRMDYPNYIATVQTEKNANIIPKTENIIPQKKIGWNILYLYFFQKLFLISQSERENNKVFSIIQVDSEKAYDLIKTVVEDLL